MGDNMERLEISLADEQGSVNGAPIIFSCNSNKYLAERIAAELGLKLGKSYVTSFSDGEVFAHPEESVRGRDCYVIQSTSTPVSDNLMELLIMTDALRRASARHITAVIPYFGYARQDRKSRPREPITSKLVANLIVTAGAERVLTMDMHCPQQQGFFDIPMDHLMGAPILESYYKEKFADDTENTVVISPDVGRIARARAFAKGLGMGLAIVDKRRPEPGVAKVMNIIGDINGKRVILADDMVDTGGTLCNDAEALLEKGATEVYACCTHAVLSGGAASRVQDSALKELVVLDTVALPMEKRIPKIKILSVAGIFAGAIYRIHKDLPLSDLYNKYM